MTTAPPTIAVIGFMAAGKSTTGRVIASRLGLPFADCDAEIETQTGSSIPELFAEGEDAFRSAEAEVAARLLSEPGVVSLGGGAVETEPVREVLAGAFCVWIDTPLEECWRRAKGSKRPLAADRGEFEARFAARRPVYESLADAVIPAGGKGVGSASAEWLSLAARSGGKLAWARSASAEYPVLVADGAVGAGLPLLTRGSGTNGDRPLPARWFAIADAAALAAHPGALAGTEATVEVTGGERAKTLAEAERVLRELTALDVRRDDGIIAFGGGVNGDLAGFCAATYQRGVALIQAPTTVVAQVDSAYGGKTGVDLPEAKNYVGAYKMPRAVLVDPTYLGSLPDAEIAAGFAEVVKTALIAGGRLWEEVRGLERIDAGTLRPLVFGCARTKLAVVAADERDRGARATLNLGHTVGHAIETVTGYDRYRHGEAVGLGLLAALRLSGAIELRAEVARLLDLAGLPTGLDASISAEEVVSATAKDKKQSADGLGFVLAAEPGRVTHGNSVGADDLLAAVRELADA